MSPVGLSDGDQLCGACAVGTLRDGHEIFVRVVAEASPEDG